MTNRTWARTGVDEGGHQSDSDKHDDFCFLPNFPNFIKINYINVMRNINPGAWGRGEGLKKLLNRVSEHARSCLATDVFCFVAPACVLCIDRVWFVAMT